MAWSLKSIGKSLGKLVTNPGKWASSVGRQAGDVFEKVDDYALPILGAATLGPLGGFLGGAAAKGIGDGRPDVGRMALGGAAGLVTGGAGAGALKSVGSALGLGAAKAAVPNLAGLAPGLTGVGSGVGGAAAGGGGLGGLLSGVGQAINGGGGVLGAARNVGGFVLDNMDPILGGLAALEGYNQSKDASRLQDEALGFARQNYADRAPLRSMGMSMLTQPPDIDPGLAIDQSNPFATPPIQAPAQRSALPVVGRRRLAA